MSLNFTTQLKSQINTILNDQFIEDLSVLDETLRLLKIEFEDQSNLAENAIPIVFEALENLRSSVANNKFKTQQEEIYFFKEIKPLFLSKLIYTNQI